MVPAVDAAAASTSAPRRARASGAGAGHDLDVVRIGVLRLIDRVCRASLDGRRDVLHQRAAGGDVEHLRAAADREQRQVAAIAAREIDLELVASRLGVVDGRVASSP